MEVVATVIYLLNVYSGSSTCPAAARIVQVLRSRHKNDTASPPELLTSMSVDLAPGLSFFMTQAPAPASVRFHTLIFCWLGVPQVE